MAQQQRAPAKAKKKFPRFWGLGAFAFAVALALGPAKPGRGVVAASARLGTPDPGLVPRLVELVCRVVPLVVLCPSQAPAPQPAPEVSPAPAPRAPQPEAHQPAPPQQASTPPVG